MNAARHWRARGGAFTLIEVLATLVLVAAILPVAMEGISMATAAAGEARWQMEAAALAEDKLAELVVTGDWQYGELSGEFDRPGPLFRWEAEVTDFDDGVARELLLRVQWTARGRGREIVLTTLVYPGSL